MLERLARIAGVAVPVPPFPQQSVLGRIWTGAETGRMVSAIEERERERTRWRPSWAAETSLPPSSFVSGCSETGTVTLTTKQRGQAFFIEEVLSGHRPWGAKIRVGAGVPEFRG